MNGARYSYLRRICTLVEQGADIVIVSEDYAAPMFDDFRVKYPERFLSVGIAEQNGMAVACGLALAGKYPIVYGCAPFPLTRAVDQVKSAVAAMHLPATILNSGIGFGVPEFGATHFNMDDIAIVRGIPGIRIVTPSDNVMAEQFADYSITHSEPIYLRFDKNSEGNLCKREKICFEKGYRILNSLDGNTDIVLITCGSMTSVLLALSKKLLEENVCAAVVDLYGIPFDEAGLLEEIRDLPIVTVEEHLLKGGIGSSILEAVNVHKQKNYVTRLGVNLESGYPSVSGGRDYFMKQYGLSSDDILQSVKAALRD